jgi:hypothetical protein
MLAMDFLSNFLKERVLKARMEGMETKGLEKDFLKVLVDSGVAARTACTAAILPAFLN